MSGSTLIGTADASASVTEFRRIVGMGYCIGCGACASVSPGIDMMLDENGLYAPNIRESSADEAAASAACPFSSHGPDEDQLGAELFAAAPHHHTALGRYVATAAGHVVEGEFRERGSSGGMGSWLLTEALLTGLVDKVMHVKAVDPDQNGGVLFAYHISRNSDEVRSGSKSRYYPIELSRVVETIRSEPGRYAVVGIPCFVKALRRVAQLDPIVHERLTLVVGLICGHLKTTGFGESLAWQLGVPPDRIGAIDFRHKLESGPANSYGFMVRENSNGREVVAPMRSLLGRDWGMGFFKPNACDYCDDVTAELADVSIGDAWLPEFMIDGRGANVVIARTPAAANMIERAYAQRRLALEPISAQRTADSQAAGLRHRREGLAYRLWLKDRRGEWRPKKRVTAAASALASRQKLIMGLRLVLRRNSIDLFRRAKAEDNFDIFLKGMLPLVIAYKAMYVRRQDLLAHVRKSIGRKLGMARP